MNPSFVTIEHTTFGEHEFKVSATTNNGQMSMVVFQGTLQECRIIASAYVQVGYDSYDSKEHL